MRSLDLCYVEPDCVLVITRETDVLRFELKFEISSSVSAIFSNVLPNYVIAFFFLVLR